VFIVSVIVLTVTSCSFTSNVQCVRLVAGVLDDDVLLKCFCYKSLVFNCCFQDTDILQSIAAIHLRCGGIFSDSTIINFLMIQTVK